jgi:hypothetical protein
MIASQYLAGRPVTPPHLLCHFGTAKRIVLSAFFSSTLCFTCRPVTAAPIPLVEFSYVKVPQFGGVSPPPVRDWEFGFSASLALDGNPALFEWFDSYGADDVGQSFQAPVQVVSGAAQALASESTRYLMFTAGLSDPSAPGRLIDWASSSSCNPCAQILVADPTVYRVTAVERVINELIVENTGFGTWVIGGKQTIRFIGEPIPEPHSVAILALAFAYCAALRIRRSCIRDRSSIQYRADHKASKKKRGQNYFIDYGCRRG